MKPGFVAGATMLALGFAPDAAAMNLQPSMLTIMQQGGMEHGVQDGCVLPGYDPHHACPVIGDRIDDGAAQRMPIRRLPSVNGH